jgi:hypothetical protein
MMLIAVLHPSNLGLANSYMKLCNSSIFNILAFFYFILFYLSCMAGLFVATRQARDYGTC